MVHHRLRVVGVRIVGRRRHNPGPDHREHLRPRVQEREGKGHVHLEHGRRLGERCKPGIGRPPDYAPAA